MNFQVSWRTWRTFLKHTHHARARYELPKESSTSSTCSTGPRTRRSQSRTEVPGNAASWPASMLAAPCRLEWRTPASARALLTRAHRPSGHVGPRCDEPGATGNGMTPPSGPMRTRSVGAKNCQIARKTTSNRAVTIKHPQPARSAVRWPLRGCRGTSTFGASYGFMNGAESTSNRQLLEPSLVGTMHGETSALTTSHESNRPRAIVHACARVHFPRNSRGWKAPCRQESL